MLKKSCIKNFCKYIAHIERIWSVIRMDEKVRL